MRRQEAGSGLQSSEPFKRHADNPAQDSLSRYLALVLTLALASDLSRGGLMLSAQPSAIDPSIPPHIG